MSITDAELRALAIVMHESAVSQGEDLMGVLLKACGHLVLDDAGIVALATKLEDVLVGHKCYACNGEGVHAPGKGYESTCNTCEGYGKLQKSVAREAPNGGGDRW